MRKWIRNRHDQWINLDNICHIWIDEHHGKYFANGEMIHNKEEVVLSEGFNSEIDCILHLREHLEEMAED